MRVKLWFAGNPIPKGSPRVTWRGTYTPEITRLWEEKVILMARDQWNRDPLRGPLGVSLTFYRENRRKVDLDNLEKAMLDALEGILYENDSQIKEKHSRLFYEQTLPGVEVEIWTL